MTEADAALWMLTRFETQGFLYQEEAATHLMQFNDIALAYFDQQSNLCIGKKVLSEFNKLTPDAVYERRDKFWRTRLATDQPGRQQ